MVIYQYMFGVSGTNMVAPSEDKINLEEFLDDEPPEDLLDMGQDIDPQQDQLQTSKATFLAKNHLSGLSINAPFVAQFHQNKVHKKIEK